MSGSSFKSVLQEYLEIKDLNIKKLSDLSGIPERYLEALLAGDNETLPPIPYIRGYIGKLAAILEFDKEEVWRLYKQDMRINGSGPLDRLPSNRFAARQFNKKFIVIGIATLLIAIYLFWNFNKLIGSPQLEIIYPNTNNVVVSEPFVNVEGKTDTNSKLTFNNSEIFVDSDGRFNEEFRLSPGLNVLEIKSKKLLGKETIVTKQIIFQEPPANATTTTSQVDTIQ